MLIIITIASILAIAILVRLADKVLSFNICPICAGVFLTWAGLLAAHFLGYQINLVIPALLMGGTVVGLAYQIEKRIFVGGRSETGWRTPFLWKTLFIPAGFVAAYGILNGKWAVFLSALAFLLLVSFLFSYKRIDTGSREETVAEIEKKMKDCC
ncbi:MAG: hypothetical protein AAB899_00345 [Patescibacteria group bacterium]